MIPEEKMRWGTVNLGGRIDAYTLELVPYLMRIINSPYLKGVNMQLMKPTEKLLVTGIVDRMARAGLTYKQLMNEEDGQYVYKLDPYDLFCVIR
jgi:hypothetical protein